MEWYLAMNSVTCLHMFAIICCCSTIIEAILLNNQSSVLTSPSTFESNLSSTATSLVDEPLSTIDGQLETSNSNVFNTTSPASVFQIAHNGM